MIRHFLNLGAFIRLILMVVFIQLYFQSGECKSGGRNGRYGFLSSEQFELKFDPRFQDIWQQLVLADGGRVFVESMRISFSDDTLLQPDSFGLELRKLPDTSAPICSLVINQGANFTPRNRIAIDVSCNDDIGSGCMNMQLSTDGNNWNTEEPFSTTKSLLSVSGDGIKSVFAKVRDKAGNWSDFCTDDIILDTMASYVIVPPVNYGTYAGDYPMLEATNTPNPPYMDSISIQTLNSNQFRVGMMEFNVADFPLLTANQDICYIALSPWSIFGGNNITNLTSIILMKATVQLLLKMLLRVLFRDLLQFKNLKMVVYS